MFNKFVMLNKINVPVGRTEHTPVRCSPAHSNTRGPRMPTWPSRAFTITGANQTFPGRLTYESIRAARTKMGSANRCATFERELLLLSHIGVRG